MAQDLATIEVQEQGITRAGIQHTGEQLALLEELVTTILRVDQDFGVIPGTGSKPTLLKPGAANVIAAFNCHSEPIVNNRIIDPTSDFVSIETSVDIISNLTGKVVARGFGECNSYEVKYRYREEQRKCPACDEPAIIKGKAEYGGGWLCWNKKGGCGAKFQDGDNSIEGQKTGRIENPDKLDQLNTYLKMSIKRAEVDAAMRLPGVARFFTQDLEDMFGGLQGEPDEPKVTPRSQPQQGKAKAPESAPGAGETVPSEELEDALNQAEMTWEKFEKDVLPAGGWTNWIAHKGTSESALARLKTYLEETPAEDGRPF